MKLLFFIFIFFLLSALADYAELAYYWQLKEYRLDRFRDFLSSILGKKFLLGYKIIFRPLLFLFLIFSLRTASVLLFIFSLDILNSFYKLASHRYLMPKFTAKAVVLIIFSLAAETALYFFNPPFIWLLAASRFLIISLIVLAINLPTKLLKKRYLRLAAAKLAGQNNLMVIGVTGSYGKTTVKNFLYQLLSAKFKIIKTPKNVNTELGIAKFILTTNFSGADIFVVEMAAYKVGEIKLICDMVRPKIGVLTAINEQHLPLFGSLKNTQTAKYELLNALPADGLAVANADNFYVRELLPSVKARVKTFGQGRQYRPDCLVKDLKTVNGRLEFSAELDNETLIDNYEIKTDLPGEYNAMNVAPVILIAEYLGLSKAEITGQAMKLELPEATMQIIKYGRSTIINDSYNANPESFKVALKYLAEQKTAGKKIVISRGMIELGEAAKKAHEEVGRQIAAVADEFIVISPDSLGDLKTGVGQAKVLVRAIFNPHELLKYLHANKTQNNLILLEGRMPKIIKDEFTN